MKGSKLRNINLCFLYLFLVFIPVAAMGGGETEKPPLKVESAEEFNQKILPNLNRYSLSELKDFFSHTPVDRTAISVAGFGSIPNSTTRDTADYILAKLGPVEKSDFFKFVLPKFNLVSSASSDEYLDKNKKLIPAMVNYFKEELTHSSPSRRITANMLMSGVHGNRGEQVWSVLYSEQDAQYPGLDQYVRSAFRGIEKRDSEEWFRFMNTILARSSNIRNAALQGFAGNMDSSKHGACLKFLSPPTIEFKNPLAPQLIASILDRCGASNKLELYVAALAHPNSGVKKEAALALKRELANGDFNQRKSKTAIFFKVLLENPNPEVQVGVETFLAETPKNETRSLFYALEEMGDPALKKRLIVISKFGALLSERGTATLLRTINRGSKLMAGMFKSEDHCAADIVKTVHVPKDRLDTIQSSFTLRKSKPARASSMDIFK
jgi:hypothetical protein